MNTYLKNTNDLQTLNSHLEVLSNYERDLLCEKDLLADAFAALSRKLFSAIEYVLSLEKLDSEGDSVLPSVKEKCDAFFLELRTENYDRSWANPAFAGKQLPGKLGGLISAIYYEAFQLPFLFRAGRHPEFQAYSILLKDLLEKRKELGLKADSVNAFDNLLSVYRAYKLDTLSHATEADILRLFGGENLSPWEKPLKQHTETENGFLYLYGMDVSSEDRSYLQVISDKKEQLDEQAAIFVKAFQEGLVRNATKCGSRTGICLHYTMGQEPFVNEVKKRLKAIGYHGYIRAVDRIPENRQPAFDHKFDDALYFDEEFLSQQMTHFKNFMETHQDHCHDYLGVMYVESFGEAPFSPVSKPENLKMSPEQTALKQKLANEKMNVREIYLPSEETSFCILGLPTCHVGEKLPEIFEATCRINAMANKDYEPVQQLVVDAADQGEYIIVKGCGKNETDMRIALPKLTDPAKQSNFVNCVAEVNVPIGEIFTSPTLKGTNGLLHLPDIYLDGFQYFNLKLTFKDGMITDFGCSNFKNEEENRNFVKENLLYPYESLPLGEFAIGTNTLAYVLSQKLDITRILPVLIVEKMGPHFAIGDTCFSHVEDVPFFNFLDKKEVIARDNEFCQKRKQNPEEGYTNVHTDITIPYDEIGLIAAILENGEQLKIIENGRFVLAGTELLNKPFLEA